MENSDGNSNKRITKNNKIKIEMKLVYVIDSLASKGGAERIILNKMEYLSAHWGYEISVITCYQSHDTPNAYPLPPQITQYYLEIPFYSQYNYSYPYRLFIKRSLKRKLRNALSDMVQSINPEILIGVSYFEADVVSSIKCRAKKLIEVHEPRPFTLSNYGLNRGLLSRLYMKFYRYRYFSKVENQSDVVVTLTPGDANEWRNAKRVEIIPNFTMMPMANFSDGSAKRVIAVGRLEWVKGYDRLLSVWKIVSEKYPTWHLDIYGTGTLEQYLKDLQSKQNLNNCMTIHSATSSINKEYGASSILIMTSRFEGFGLVLLEAMQVGLPCVAFDCPFGPAAVIKDGENGFLVPDGNIEQMAIKLSLLMDNLEMRRQFAQSALRTSKLFAVDVVMKRWNTLFEELVRN